MTDIIRCPGCGAVAEHKIDIERGDSWWETAHASDCPWMLNPDSEPYS